MVPPQMLTACTIMYFPKKLLIYKQKRLYDNNINDNKNKII
jgi:hypothetical protein